MKLMLCMIFTFLIAIQVCAQECSVDSGFRGGGFSIQYEQRHLVKKINKLKELPPTIKNKLNQYLQQRVGITFAKKLQFDEGQWLDLQRLRQEFPHLYDENQKNGTYVLLFRFSASDKGLKYFYAEVRLNDDGSINQEIKLPNIGKAPSKGQIVSCKEAVAIAVKEGFPKERISTWFEYSSERDCFIWELSDSQRNSIGIVQNLVEIPLRQGIGTEGFLVEIRSI